MAALQDVRRGTLSPQASQAGRPFRLRRAQQGKLREFAWRWDERIQPGKPTVPSPQVPAVRVASLAENANCSQPIRRPSSRGRL